MRTVIILLLLGCNTESQIIDGRDCPSAGIIEETTVMEVNQCPEIPACPDVNIECPQPNIQLTCPEPVIVVEAIAPEPIVQVDVEAPSVQVDVEAPDFSDLITALEDLALSSTGDFEYHAQTGVLYASQGTQAVFTNASSNDFIITSMIDQGSGYLECQVVDSSGNIEIDLTSIGYWFRRPTSVCCGHIPQAYNSTMSFPVSPGGELVCGSGTGSTTYVMQGYYQ